MDSKVFGMSIPGHFDFCHSKKSPLPYLFPHCTTLLFTASPTFYMQIELKMAL